MKRKLIAIFGLASPLVLLGCATTMILVAAISLWLYSDEESSRTVRIMMLSPLATTQAIQEQLLTQEEQSEHPIDSNEVETKAANPLPTATQPQAEVSLSEEEVEARLGFSIPDGSVNSITQVGLADRLVIPKLNLDAPIVLSPIENQTWKVDHLGQSVGHLEGTAPPGSNSNFVLAAHVTLSSGVYGPFAGLGQLAPGDVIQVYDDGQMYEYIVDGFQTVDRTAVNVTYPSTSPEITLITCNNWSADEGRYVERLVVKGHLGEG